MVTTVECYPKAVRSIAITPRCREWCNSVPGITPLYPRYVPYNADCLARRYQGPFFVVLI